MKFTSTIILFLALASLTAATTFSKFGKVTDSKCDSQSPTPSTTEDVPTEWTPTNIYAVQVCAVSEAAVKDCSKAAKSSLTLTVTFQDETKVTITPKEFELKDLTDSKSFCHIFEVCDFLPQLKDKVLTGSTIKADAILGAQVDASGVAKFKVSMQATSYVMTVDEVKTVGTDAEPFSVVCDNFACDVAADNVLEISTKTLTVVNGQNPQCETSTKADEDAKKLYVSLFKCLDGNCPESFKVTVAASSSSTPEPEASEPESESSSALPITGIASAFIATILSLIV